MKYLIAISALLVVALTDDPHGLKGAHEKCHMGALKPEPKTGPSSESASHEGHHAHKHEHHITHFNCLAKELGLVSNEGKVVLDGVKLHVGHVISDTGKAEEIVKICAQDRGTADATAEHVVKCLYKKHVFTDGDNHHGSSESEESDSSGHHHLPHGHAHGPEPLAAPAEIR